MKLFLEIYFAVPALLYIMFIIKKKRMKVDWQPTLLLILFWPFIIISLIWENL